VISAVFLLRCTTLFAGLFSCHLLTQVFRFPKPIYPPGGYRKSWEGLRHPGTWRAIILPDLPERRKNNSLKNLCELPSLLEKPAISTLP